MPVTILLPTPFRRFARGSRSVEVIADTVEGALLALARQHLELRHELFDEQGRLRSFISVFRGDESTRDLAPDGGPVPVREGDVLTLLLAIAGGAPTAEELSPDEILRYQRQLTLPEVTLDGQKRLMTIPHAT